MQKLIPLCRQVQAKIRKLELLASSGLWILALFVGLSLCAYRDFSFFPPLSEQLRAQLGSGPPVNYINWALVLYGFSALILVLTRMTGDQPPRGGWAHLFYLAAFYAFYHFAAAMEENFWAVFTAGMTILSLQGYHIWNHYQEKLKEQRDILAELEKLID